MEIILYIYFGINLMILGSYISSYYWDIFQAKIFCCLLLFFFGGILVIYEFTIADKVAEWWDNSKLNFLYSLYILKKFDSLESDEIEYLKKSISAQKDKNSKLTKHLTKIANRNSQKDTVK